MTLYELTNSCTIQGNICVTLFDSEQCEKQRWYVRDEDDFTPHLHDELSDYEDLDITFMYASKGCDGTQWLNIEIQEA